jgi:hypothetical protein
MPKDPSYPSHSINNSYHYFLFIYKNKLFFLILILRLTSSCSSSPKSCPQGEEHQKLKPIQNADTKPLIQPQLVEVKESLSGARNDL